MSEPSNAPTSPPVNHAPVQTRQVEGTQATPPYLQSPQDRFAADQAELARRDPWMRDPSTTVMMRDADGNVAFRDRTSADSVAVEPAKPGEQPKPGHADVADNVLRIVGQDGKEFHLGAEDIAGLMERHAIEEARRLAMPSQPAGYEAKLPADFAAKGVEVRIDETDPALTDLRNFAHKHGWSQEQFSQVLGIEAARLARDAAAVDEARRREIQKLGTNAHARYDAVMTWARGMVGDKGAAELAKGMITAGQIETFESLIRKFVSQGGGSYSAAHRDPDQYGPTKLSQAEYDKLTYAEKKEYAARFQAAADQRVRR